MKWRRSLLWVVVFWGLRAFGQRCPQENPGGPPIASMEREIDGLVVLHDGIRRWVELRPDIFVCSNKSIELIPLKAGSSELDEAALHQLERLRGCYIAAHGRLDIPGTGYYSAPLYMDVEGFEKDAGCKPQPALRDYSRMRPLKTVRRYRVAMHVYYRGDGKVDADIRDGKQSLRPWQAYANYSFTGGYVIYGRCATGFHMSDVSGTPEAKPELIDEQAAMDPEGAAAKGVWEMTLRYSCSR